MNALGGKHIGAGSRLRPSFWQPVECSDRSATNRLSLRISMETKLNSRKRCKTTLKGRDPMRVVTKWPRCAKEQCGAAHTNKQGALHQGKHLSTSIIRRHVCDDAVHHGPVVKPRAPNGRSLIFGGLKLNVVCGPWHALVTPVFQAGLSNQCLQLSRRLLPKGGEEEAAHAPQDHHDQKVGHHGHETSLALAPRTHLTGAPV